MRLDSPAILQIRGDAGYDSRALLEDTLGTLILPKDTP